jgi:hypothetical protein
MKAALAREESPGVEDLLTGIQEFLSEIQLVLDDDKDYFHE